MARFPLQFQAQDQKGNILVGGTVTITETGGTTAAITYAASTGGTDQGGVYTTDNDGRIKCWIEEGDYAANSYFRIVMSGAQFVTQTIDDVVIMPLLSSDTASPALDNLAAVAINTSLISDTASADDLGSSAIPWNALYLTSTVVFGGSTNDANRTLLTVTDPTANRTITLPDLTGTVSLVAAAETLTNKTLTAPIIATIANSGTLTLPSGADTLVGRASTDTLTNKTLTAPVIATIVNSGTLTVPSGTDTLVGRASTDTLTNKTLTSPTLTTPALGVATGTSLDLGGTTLLGSRALIVDTGGVFNIALSGAAGDDFTVGTTSLVVEGDNGYVGVGLADPTAALHVDQHDATANITVINLEQGDVSEGFINFIGTSQGNTDRSISEFGTSGATTDHIRCQINGVDCWIAVSTNPPTA